MTTSELIFDEDEYLCEVRTRQGDIVDQITLCTNKRVATFGGMGGTADPRNDLPVDLTKRVVAFVGSFDGVLHRLGTCPSITIGRLFVSSLYCVVWLRVSELPSKKSNFPKKK